MKYRGRRSARHANFFSCKPVNTSVNDVFLAKNALAPHQRLRLPAGNFSKPYTRSPPALSMPGQALRHLEVSCFSWRQAGHVPGELRGQK